MPQRESAEPTWEQLWPLEWRYVPSPAIRWLRERERTRAARRLDSAQDRQRTTEQRGA